MRWRRWLAGLGFVGLGVVGVALVGATGFGVWLSTPGGNTWLEHRIENAVTLSMDEGAFEIDGLQTDLLYNLRIDGLRIVDGAGISLVEVGPARARVNTATLLHGPLVVHELEGAGLDVVLDTGSTGRMRIAELFGPPSGSTDPFELPIDLDVRSLRVEGVSVRRDAAVDVRGGVLEGQVVSSGPVFDVSDLALCAHILEPGPTTACVEGPVIWDGYRAALSGAVLTAPGSELAVGGTVGSDAFDLAVHAGAIDLEALDPLANDAGIRGTWAGEVALKGPPDALAITGRLAGTGASRGGLGIDGHASLGSEITWGGVLTAYGFHVEDAYPAAGRPVVLDGEVGLEAQGVAFPDDLVLDLTYAGRADLEEGTYILEDTEMRGQIAKGVLTLARGAFTGIAGRLDATGTIDLVHGPMNLGVTGTIDPREIAEIGIEGLGGRGTTKLVITGDLRKEPGRFGVRGRVRMAPFSYTDDIRFESVVADLRGGVDGVDFTFDVDAVATNGVAYDLEMASVDADAVHVTSRAKDMQAVGPAHVEGLYYPSAGRFDFADVEFDYRLPDGGDIAVDAGIVLGPFDLQTFPGTGGRATVSMLGSAVDYGVLLDAWGREFAASRGGYDLETARLEAEFLRVAPTARLAWESSGPVDLTVVEGGVRDASVDMRGVHGDFVLQGDLATVGDLGGTVVVEQLQLDALAELFPETFPGLSGVMDLDLDLTGPATDPEVVGTTDVQGFWLEDVARWLDFAGGFTLKRGRVDTTLDVGSAGEPLAVVSGEVPVLSDLAAPGLDPDGRVGMRVVLKPGALERLEHVTPTELGVPEGRISAQIDLTGVLGNPDIRLAGVVESEVGGWNDPGRVELDLRRKATDLVAWAEVREGLAERVRVSGSGTTRMERVFDAFFTEEEMPDTANLELWLDNMAVSAVLNGLPADSVMRAAELELAAGGELVGGFTASGSPWTPEIEGGVHWFRPSLGNEQLEGAYLTLSPLEQGLSIDSTLTFPEGSLGVSGPLPIAIDFREDVEQWAQGELGLEITGDGVPLGILSVVDRGIIEAEGLLDIGGSITGTFDDPVPQLTGSIVDGALTYLPMGLHIRDIRAEAQSDDRRIRLTKFEALTSPLNQVGLIEDRKGSRLSVTGSANLARGVPEKLSARIVHDDAWVIGTYEAAVRLDGELFVSGRWPDLNVFTKPGEDLELVTGRVIYNSAAAQVAGPLEVNDRIVVHRDGERRQTERVEELPLYAGFDVDVGLDLNRNLEVIAAIPFFDQLGSITANLTRANASTRLGGDVDIALDAFGNPLLSGEVEVVDGSVQILRTRFSLDEGRVVFLGGDVGNTQLDIRGSTNIEGTPVDLIVTGTADEPTLETQAPGYDDTQVLVMLLTGQSPDSLRGDASRAANDEAAAIAGTAAALVASSFLSGSATGALTIEPDGGIRIGAPWSTTVLTELVLHPLADQDENLAAFSLEWALARRLLLDVGVGSTFQWAGVSWETRF